MNTAQKTASLVNFALVPDGHGDGVIIAYVQIIVGVPFRIDRGLANVRGVQLSGAIHLHFGKWIRQT